MIETKRLIIKKIETDEEVKALLAIYNKAENMKYIQSGKCNWTYEELTERYCQINKEAYKYNYGYFVVKLKDEDIVIGEAGIFNSFASTAKMEIGYIIDAAYWNKGYGTEICIGLINYMQTQLKCTEIVARMYEENIGSIRVCEKAGFQLYQKGTSPNKKAFKEYRIIK